MPAQRTCCQSGQLLRLVLDPAVTASPCLHAYMPGLHGQHLQASGQGLSPHSGNGSGCGVEVVVVCRLLSLMQQAAMQCHVFGQQPVTVP